MSNKYWFCHLLPESNLNSLNLSLPLIKIIYLEASWKLRDKNYYVQILSIASANYSINGLSFLLFCFVTDVLINCFTVWWWKKKHLDSSKSTFLFLVLQWSLLTLIYATFNHELLLLMTNICLVESLYLTFENKVCVSTTMYCFYKCVIFLHLNPIKCYALWKCICW